MATTFTLIKTYTLATATASFDFTSIPATFTDLVVKLSVRCADAAQDRQMFMKYNGSSTSMASRVLRGSGSAASSYTSTSMETARIDGAGSTASTFSNIEIYIPNYAGATYKSASSDGVTENNATGAFAELAAHLWSNTNAINQITFTVDGGTNFVTYSTASLYGILKA
jgi:hypothetical protein